MIYMFNELSITNIDSKEEVRTVLEKFIKSTIRANEIGFDELRLYHYTLTNLFQIQLSINYTIDNWLKDNEVNSDLKDRFREIFTSYPLISENEFEEYEDYNWSEFYILHDKRLLRVYGLGASHLYNTLSISLKTSTKWDNSFIEIFHQYLINDGDKVEVPATIRHFSDIETLNTHIEWWNKIQNESLSASVELWERRDEFFPNLYFCESVKIQLSKIGVSKQLFQIIERLKALNNYAKDWTTGNFNYEHVNATTNLRISPESVSTIRKFGTQRQFHIPEVGKKLFDLHIKTGELRFHFYPDNNTRKIYIGYIGKHLRISSED